MISESGSQESKFKEYALSIFIVFQEQMAVPTIAAPIQGRSKETEFFNSAHILSSIRGPYGGICYLLKHLLSCHLVSIFCQVCNCFLQREHMRGRSWESLFCLSVRLSHAWIVTKLNDALPVF